MAKENVIFMGSDALLQATGLIDVESSDPVNTATITVSIFEGARRHPVGVLAFTGGGTAQIVKGDIITGDTSGATALVHAITQTGGNWNAGTASGQIEVTGQDGVFQNEDISTATQANIATIPAGDSTGLAVVLLGGGQVKIPMNTTGLTTDDYIRIESSKHYNDQFDIDAIDVGQAGYVTITAVNVAESMRGDEPIYIGIGGGKDIALTHVGGDPDGYYDGIQPDTLENVFDGKQYFVFEKITYAGNIMLHRYQWEAAYYANLLQATS